MKFTKLLLIIAVLVLSASGLAAQTAVMVDKRGSKLKIENAEPIVISVDAKGILKLGEKSLTISRLGGRLDAALDERQPPERIIYIKADPKVPFSQIVKLLKLGRTIKQDSFGLILDAEGLHGTSDAVMTKIKLHRPTRGRNVNPNPLYLGLAFETNGGLSLNGESHTPLSLTTKLQKIFSARSENGVFIEGTEEVERTIFLVPSATTTFDAIVKAASLITEAGAQPIGIELDPPQPMVIRITGIR